MAAPSSPDIALEPFRWSSAAFRGAGLVLIATFGWSFFGLFTRMLTLDIWTAVALRSLTGGFFLFLFLLMRDGAAAFRNLVTLGAAGWAVVSLSVVAQGTTTAAFFLTSVAHTAVIYATCPFMAALIARLWLREKIGRTTAIAIAASMIGVVLVAAGSSGPSTLLGDAVAFLMTASFALIIVLARSHPNLRLPEITSVSAFLVFLIFLPFASAANLDLRNGAIVSLYGFVSIVFSFLLFLRGARYIPAATSGLIITLDIVLSPYWVWLFFDERIDLLTFIGGAIVAIAVVGHLVLSMRQARSAAP
jgi:drug/metabolite transporter (DMT)-like permease